MKKGAPTVAPNTVTVHDVPDQSQKSVVAKQVAELKRHNPAHTWYPIIRFNLYRLVIGGTLVFLHISGNLPAPLDTAIPVHFLVIASIFIVMSILGLFAAIFRYPASFTLQLYSAVVIDIIAITLMMHASGGIKSGVGMLLVISVANSSMLMRRPIPGFMAALTTVTVLLEQVYSLLHGYDERHDFVLAGFLGTTLFATALLTHLLARRTQQSEALAVQRGIDLANMAQITKYIIQQMSTGVLVVDHAARVRLMNNAAAHLLSHTIGTLPRPLIEIDTTLALHYRRWHQHGESRSLAFRIDATGQDVLPSFAVIGDEEGSGTLIFLQDIAQANLLAQQIKLASLGRLTASIAHEIRNPLTAISHASALLDESPHLNEQEERLLEIIQHHTQRVNTIIHDILQLGRRDRVTPAQIELMPWLERFREEYMASENHAAGRITLEVETDNTLIRFDPVHLHQILWNLCHNGLRHSGKGEAARVRIAVNRQPEGFTSIDVIDNGPGVSDTVLPNLFEPFYTTAKEGNGLGLYISRELAESNRAELSYNRTTDGKSCFRLRCKDWDLVTS